MIVVAAYAAIDSIWVPYAEQNKHATSLFVATVCFHEVLTLFYFPLLFSYMKRLTWQPLQKTWIWISFSWIISILLAVYPQLFFYAQGYNIYVTDWYKIIIAPYLLLYMMYSLYVAYSGYKRAPLQNKRIFYYHFIGIFVLFLAGVIDLYCFLSTTIDLEISFASYALVIYTGLTTYAFLKRFLNIIREREDLSQNLSQAYREATEGKTLQQIGESTSKINHEFRNYLTIILNNIPSLEETENNETFLKSNQKKIQSITKASEQMLMLCDGLLNLSRQQFSNNSPTLNVYKSLHSCIHANFAVHSDSFHIMKPQETIHIPISSDKWEQVLVQLWKNSIEAGATKVVAEVTLLQNLMSLSIRDNGKSVSAVDLPRIFEAFFTTKRRDGKAGIGLSITKTILENLGGWISAYKPYSGGMDINIQVPIPRQAKSRVYSKPVEPPIIILWASSSQILKEVTRKCQQLRVELDILPLSNWNSCSETDFHEKNVIHFVEETHFTLADVTRSNFSKNTRFSEYYLIWDEAGLYIDGEPFSESNLIHLLKSTND
jgi:signal transduction histidine kinase